MKCGINNALSTFRPNTCRRYNSTILSDKLGLRSSVDVSYGTAPEPFVVYGDLEFGIVALEFGTNISA